MIETGPFIVITILFLWLGYAIYCFRSVDNENRRLREKLRKAEIALMDRDDKLGRMNDEAEDVTEWPEVFEL